MGFKNRVALVFRVVCGCGFQLVRAIGFKLSSFLVYWFLAYISFLIFVLYFLISKSDLGFYLGFFIDPDQMLMRVFTRCFVISRRYIAGSF